MKNEVVLVTLLIQLIVIVLIARIAGLVGRRLGHPIVVGEILAGLFLGPSFLGKAFPGLFHALFPPAGPGSTNQIIYMMSQIGLIFLMFMIGMEFDFANIKSHGKSAGLVSVSGIALPFALGVGFGYWLHPQFPQTNETAFCLFIGTAVSITAIPILGRILIEFNLTRTDVGVLTITAAAIDDALGWMCLAIVSAIVSSHLNAVATTQMVALTVLFAIFLVKIFRPLAIKMLNKELARKGGTLGLDGLAVLIVVILGCATITNKIGISSLFGPFMLGACLYDQVEFRESVFHSMKNFITAFFLPIFFSFTGLNTDMGTLGSGLMWIALGLLLFVSFFGKFVGCFFAAKLSGFPNRQSAAIGIMMNTRALMGLIAANIGLEMGAIPKSVYCMLVLMCVISTILASPVLRRLIRGTELEKPYSESEYVVSRREMGLRVKELEELIA
ncbi:MAG TPA: cation:proton antiporter [Fimbriimonadaceae bacterium]|jgi:Kef-type K+ transport system membrane component KefB